MEQKKATFIKVPTELTGGFQTMPTEPSRRLPDSEVRIEICTEADALRIAEIFYTSFPEDWWAKKEPVELRPAKDVRYMHLAKRISPALKNKHIVFIKAVLVSTGEVIGVAGWTLPSHPGVHNLFRRSAVDHFEWQPLMGWSDAEVEEMWAHVGPNWNTDIVENDERRSALMKGKGHWYLAPLLVWPEHQGRGVGSRLMRWAIDQADATDPPTPMFLECKPSAKAVYLHLGFEEVEDCRLIRWGPKDVGERAVSTKSHDG